MQYLNLFSVSSGNWQIVSNVASIIGILSVIVGVLIGYYKWAFHRGVNHAAYAEKQLRYIYGPLRIILIDTHIASWSFIKYSYFSVRFRRARRLWGTKEHRKSIAALFDRGVTDCGADIEYGGPFSLVEVSKIIEKGSHVADAKLLGLYGELCREQAEYSSHGESYPPSPLSKNYLDFINHVYDTHESLSRELK